MIKSWTRYFILLAVLGVGGNVIYLALPIYMMIVYDRVLFSYSLATLATMIVGVLISLSMVGLIEFCRRQLLTQLGNMFAEKMIPAVLRKMLQDASSVQQHGYTRGIEDLERLRKAIVQGQIFSILDLAWIIIYLAILFFIHHLVGGVAALFLFMILMFQVLLMILEEKRITVADGTFFLETDHFKTSLQHAELVAAMGMSSPVQQRYIDRYYQSLTLRSEADRFESLIGATLRFLFPTALAAVFGMGAYVFFANMITTGAIFAMVMVMARLLIPFEHWLADTRATIEAVASFRRLQHHIKLEPPEKKLSLPPPEGTFVAESVSLMLNGKAVVHNVSFALKPGETLGVTGPFSAGKTSLCKVLLGIWPATRGIVRLDGADITQWPEEELRQYVGYVPQEPELFPASVAENIARLQQVDATKVVASAQKAGIHEMILKLPQGYETKIDQRGRNLSAGQRQLISLARALYDQPKLVVLDEPHAHLDDVGLRFLAQAIQNMKREAITVVLVTDRSHILAAMDKLLILRDGQVALYGPSKEVLGQIANRQQQSTAV